ncbi:MAG: hypothetical protein ACE5GC_08770 [Acidimicrobiia bacterium]
MATDSKRRKGTKRPGLAIVASLVLVPASAIAAVALASSPIAEPLAEATIAAAPSVAAIERTQPTASTISYVQDPVTALPSDLETACTTDAATLVEAELSETISPLQIAALDALRLICAEEGLDLPGPPAPPPIVRTVRVTAAAPTTDTGPATRGSDEKHHEDHDEKKHDDDHHHHEKKHHDDDHDEEKEHDDDD